MEESTSSSFDEIFIDAINASNYPRRFKTGEKVNDEVDESTPSPLPES